MNNNKNKEGRLRYFKPLRRKRMKFEYFVKRKLDLLLFKFVKKFVTKI